MNTRIPEPVVKGVLLILDGMGLSDDSKRSATTASSMPFVHRLMADHGYAQLHASGTEVGLDAGKAGNSEVGHLTIGAGRVLPSTLARIRGAYEDGSWERSPAWGNCDSSRPLHVAGLLSDAGVHAHWQTMVQAAELGVRKGFPVVYLHPFLDGVDSQAGTAPALLAELQRAITPHERIRLGSIMGRKWASDRAGNWGMTRHCRDALMGRLESPVYTGEQLASHLRESPSEADFPHALMPGGAAVRAGETVVLTNHRADRISQLARSLNEECHVVAMVELNHEATPLDDVFFRTESIDGGLGDTLKDLGFHTIRLAEECKFPHVTYFFNGMKPDDDAEAVAVPTIPDEALRTTPAMSIDRLGLELEGFLARGNPGDVLIVNVPNLDQVGHQGDLEAARQAAAAVDRLVETVVEPGCRQYGWELVITADHGNADVMLDEQGRPMGSHSSNPVPMLAIPYGTSHVRWRSRTGTLANVAASLLTLLGAPCPARFDDSLIAVEHS